MEILKRIFSKEIVNLSDDLNVYSFNKSKIIEEFPHFQKTIEYLVEFLLSKEKADENFLEFCENLMLEKIIIITKFHENKINTIILKNLIILIPSLQDKTMIYYFFSNNYMNQLIDNLSYNLEEKDNDYYSYYINFLKSVVNKLDKGTFALFFNKQSNNFTLIDKILMTFRLNSDIMIKNTARNMFLNLLKLNYKPFIEYICNIPTVSLFLLFMEKIKANIQKFIQLKKQKKATSINCEEIKENLIDEISFIQDIFSVDIPKINYLLINCLLAIPLKYLFNNIIIHDKVYISFYVIDLFIKYLRNETVKNLILVLLFSPQIHAKIIEIIVNDESAETYRLLKLNNNLSNFSQKLKQKNINGNKSISYLNFEEFLILNYSENFLKSIRYITDTNYPFYNDFKEIIDELNNNENILPENDIKNIIKILDKKFPNMNNIIKKMNKYHRFISECTGINVGVSYDGANESLLNVIYNNMLMNKYDNNLEERIYFQENILKKECMFYITQSPLRHQINAVNELFLIYDIINDEHISYELKKYLNLNKYEMETKKGDEEEQSKVFFDINSMDDAADSIEIYNNNLNINHEKEIIKNQIEKEGIIIANNEKKKIRKDFHRSQTFSNVKENNLKKIYGINMSDKMNPLLSNLISFPYPISSDENYDSIIYFTFKNEKYKYSEITNLNNDYFIKIISNSKINNIKTNYDNKYILLDKLISIILNKQRILNKLIYKLSLDIIELLILDTPQFWYFKNKYQNIITESYRQLLQNIEDFLPEGNNSISFEKISENFVIIYDIFEKCFLFNKLGISHIKNKYFNDDTLLLNNFNEKYSETNDLMKIPNDKTSLVKCLFQKIICLYDLKKITSNYNDVNKKSLLKFQKFPLYFFDLEKFNENKKITLQVIKKENILVYSELSFKKSNEEEFKEGTMFIFHNYIFLSFLEEGEIKIKLRIPLRKINISTDKESILRLNITKDKDLGYDVLIKFPNKFILEKYNNIIEGSIKNSYLLEYSAIKKYIEKLILEEKL